MDNDPINLCSVANTDEKVVRCAALLGDAQGLLVITGAGISAESGMPTYRGPNGLYEKNPEIPLVLSEEGLVNEPHKLWEHLDALRIKAAEAQPNLAHQILAQWERGCRFNRFLIAPRTLMDCTRKPAVNG